MDFPLETSTASFSRCSEMVLAGSEIGKSEGIELSVVVSSNCIISSLKKKIVIIISSLRNRLHFVQPWLIY